MKTLWGFLRENQTAVENAGDDEYTGVTRTSLLKYLKVILPQVDDWIAESVHIRLGVK